MRKCRVQCRPGFYIFLAIAALLIPVKWLAAWFAAALIHESFHILALRICNYRISAIDLGLTGARIHTDSLSGLKMTFCALSGPLGGFLLLLLIRVAPRLAICGAIQSLYNLIPVYPLDGGRAVRGVAEHFFHGSHAAKFLAFWENAVLILLVALSVWSAIKLHLGLFPALCVCLLIYRNKKIPCKESRLRVK